jgi:hypothetical protein
MRNNIFIITIVFVCVSMALSSCTPEAYEASGPPLAPTPIITDSIINPSVYSISGQTWVIERYRIGQIGEINQTADTVVFNANGAMQFNDVDANYAFYPSASVYILTLYQTPWGMLSGSVNPFNLEVGEILGLPFSNISVGGNGMQVYLWMRRL